MAQDHYYVILLIFSCKILNFLPFAAEDKLQDGRHDWYVLILLQFNQWSKKLPMYLRQGNEVRNYPCIYNKAHVDHYKQNKKQENYDIIGTALGVTGNFIYKLHNKMW